MAAPLLTLKDIGLGFGGDPLFDGTEMIINRGDRISLVGRNGSGKSTLLKVAAGLVEPDRGERVLQQGCRVSYLEQEPSMADYTSVMAYVVAGLPHGEDDEAHRAEIIIEDLKLDGNAAPDTLSGGEKRRAALAQILVGEPDLLLLDEPTNHLDINTIQWLEKTLKSLRSGYVLISHDRALLSNMTTTTFWLDRGKVRRLDAGFAKFDAWANDILVKEATERHKLDRLIAKETVWSHQGISARRTRNQGRLRHLRDLRQQRAQQIDPTGQIKLTTQSGSSSGRLVIEAEDISFAYDDRPIVQNFSTRIMRGDRVGIIGPNGAGKSTLLALLSGERNPDSGQVQLGTNLTPVYLDQSRSLLDPEKTVWDTLCDMGGDMVDVHGKPRHVVSYLRDFLFSDNQARSPVGSLSGGERNRLLLAKTLAKPSNLLILDEPTNDLDMDTLDLLQEMLSEYDGTLLLISHDRDFLDRIVTSTIVMEESGQIEEYPGGYSDYIRQRAHQASVERKKDRSVSTTAEPKKSGTSARKFNYNQQRAHTQLPKDIEKLEAEIKTCEATLADPALYDKDPDKFSKTAKRLTQAREEMERAEDQWLELEMLREELAGS